MAEQLPLNLPRGEQRGAADFHVSPANAAAHDMALGSVRWPNGKLLILGPPGAGKSHLAAIWSDRTGATVLAADSLSTPNRPGPVVVDGLERLSAGAEAELFHLHNRLGEAGLPLLMTSRKPPSALNIALPDLASRLAATTLVQVGEPDDALIPALLTKLLADRGLMPTPAALAYIVPRVTRSYAGLIAVADRLDRVALRDGAEINRALAASVLGSMRAT